jgi:hypothetical protein
MRKRRGLLIVVVAVVVLGSACSGGGSKTGSTGTTGAATSSGSAGAALATGAAIANTKSALGDVPYQLDILALQRTGDHVTLRFAVTNLDPARGAPVISDDFIDTGADEAQQKADSSRRSFSGVYVVDDVNSKKYFPFRDTDGNCVCSANIFKIDKRVELFATFPAPPRSVKTVTVSVPQFGAIPNLPISG